jgi:hypothetical protein
MQENKSYLS